VFAERYSFEVTANSTFVKYMVDLKTQQAYANQESDIEGIKYYEWWFENLEKLLRELYSESGLKLVYDYKNYDFKILTSDGKRFGFNEMSDGYSAVFDIVSEVMSRMENYTEYRYDFQGIVLIDEIETHLHVELQKSILPILISLFPNIQFIVTTHSPFVLSSIKNAIIYDIEKNESVEDLSKYSYENIVQNYFEVNSFSNEIINFISDYEEKVNMYCNKADEGVLQELEEMETYFNENEFSLDESLVYQYNKIRIRKKAVANG
jgi:predicted ATP-binding protein involved in virulence